MATYKVIQDIEAEDKLLGPLTLRQFIYAIIAIGSGAIIFKIATVNWLFALPFVPHTILFFVLAAPFGHDQPSEVWLLARIRFFLKPRRRVWDQSGLKQLVTITVPKKIERQLTNGLSQTEVKSRLEALANTIDSRGWAIKNVNVNLFSQPSYVLAQTDSDRLIDPTTISQDVQNFDVRADDDMLDIQNNSTAQHFTQLINQSQQAHRQQIMQQMQGTAPATPPDYWFLNQAAQQKMPDGYASFDNSHLVNPGAAPPTMPNDLTPEEEQAFLKKVHEEQAKPKQSGHLKKILPLEEQRKAQAKKKKAVPVTTKSTVDDQPAKPVQKQPEKPSVTEAPRPAILELANNSDLNVATIARQAEKATKSGEDEVIVKLR